MGQTSCILLGLECHVWNMRNDKNVMEYVKPGEQMRMMMGSKIMGNENKCEVFLDVVNGNV